MKLFEKFKRDFEKKLFERDFGFALLSLSTQLNIGIDFEQALKNIAFSDFGIVSQEFQRVIKETENGSSIPASLLSLSERMNSSQMKRGFSLIISAYDKGRKQAGKEIKVIALELLAIQKNTSKSFSSKILVLSLMFIAVSAIIPALFQAFVLIGSMFLEIDFSPIELLLVVSIGFPLIDLAMLFYMKLVSPV